MSNNLFPGGLTRIRITGVTVAGVWVTVVDTPMAVEDVAEEGPTRMVAINTTTNLVITNRETIITIGEGAAGVQVVAEVIIITLQVIKLVVTLLLI